MEEVLLAWGIEEVQPFLSLIQFKSATQRMKDTFALYPCFICNHLQMESDVHAEVLTH